MIEVAFPLALCLAWGTIIVASGVVVLSVLADGARRARAQRREFRRWMALHRPLR